MVDSSRLGTRRARLLAGHQDNSETSPAVARAVALAGGQGRLAGILRELADVMDPASVGNRVYRHAMIALESDHHFEGFDPRPLWESCIKALLLELEQLP